VRSRKLVSSFGSTRELSQLNAVGSLASNASTREREKRGSVKTVTWAVGLAGRSRDLESLVRELNLPYINVIEAEDGSGFYLTSIRLEVLETPREVLAAAEPLIAQVNGAIRLVDADARPIIAGGVRWIADDGAVSVFVMPDTIRIKVRFGGQPTADATALEKASRDELVAQALGYFSDPTWVNLTKVRETIEQDLAVSLVDKGWVSQTKLDRFNHQANYEERHARGEVDKPSKPMTIAKAEQLIGSILKAWLAQK